MKDLPIFILPKVFVGSLRYPTFGVVGNPYIALKNASEKANWKPEVGAGFPFRIHLPIDIFKFKATRTLKLASSKATYTLNFSRSKAPRTLKLSSSTALTY